MSVFKTFERWSWSQLQTYRECPFRARLRYIERSPEPPREGTEPPERGIKAHKAAENFVGGALNVLPKELVPFQELLTAARELRAEHPDAVELERPVYLDRNWQPTNKDNRWLVYIPDLRISTDKLCLTVDYKTGRKYGNEVKHFGQQELYNIGAWIEKPDYDEYKGEIWYLDKKDVAEHSFTPEHLEKARARLDAEVTKMMEDKIHQPRPNKVTCKWCPYSPRGTGACPVGV